MLLKLSVFQASRAQVHVKYLYIWHMYIYTYCSNRCCGLWTLGILSRHTATLRVSVSLWLSTSSVQVYFGIEITKYQGRLVPYRIKKEYGQSILHHRVLKHSRIACNNIMHVISKIKFYYYTSGRGALSLCTAVATDDGTSCASLTAVELYFCFVSSCSSGLSLLMFKSVPVISIRNSSSWEFQKSSFSLGTPQFPYLQISLSSFFISSLSSDALANSAVLEVYPIDVLLY